jgi:hypothetical protein
MALSVVDLEDGGGLLKIIFADQWWSVNHEFLKIYSRL